MISSAVVIPDEQPTSPSLKRRLSSPDSDANKRPRIETQLSSDVVSREGDASSGTPSSPTRRKTSAVGTGAAEEKKRGQRLFGALLGTLSQTSSKPVHKRRDEIEQRQRERLRKDDEQRGEQMKRKREELNKVRIQQQKVWDRETVKLRHRNMRMMANFLQTRAEPKLYFKPWELRPEEEERIKTQIDEVEELIQREEADKESRDLVPQETKTLPAMDEKTGTLEEVQDVGDLAVTISSAKDNPEEANSSILNTQPNDSEQPKEEEQEGEEVVEGQEDDVMY